MWRTKAVQSMLLEEVGGLPADIEALARARRRCRWVVGLDWAAIIVLVLLHDGVDPQLTLAGTPQTVFTLGILAVAVHSGLRLGQLLSLNAIARLHEELRERRDG